MWPSTHRSWTNDIVLFILHSNVLHAVLQHVNFIFQCFVELDGRVDFFACLYKMVILVSCKIGFGQVSSSLFEVSL